MPNARRKTAAKLLLLPVATAFVACAPEPQDAAPVAEPSVLEAAAPLYISRKQVSTDCGVEATPPPFPGFADRPNAKILDMAPPVANMLAVGADRPMVETDHERVSPGLRKTGVSREQRQRGRRDFRERLLLIHSLAG